jgi:hypothetical protein
MSSHCEHGNTECRCTLELVWDDDLNATAFTAEGGSVRVGPEANLSPPHVLALAASSCLMTMLLQAAAEAGVLVEGYLSSARVHYSADGTCNLALAPCVVVTSETDRVRMDSVWEAAIQRSPALRLFGERLQIEPVVRVVPPE